MEVFGPSLGADAVGEARAAEAAGFSGVRVLDHLFCAINDGPVNTFDHPLVALGAAAAVTNRIVLTQTMLDVTRRHPTEVAQAIATLDRLSGGRAELGLGAGWYLPEHNAVGISLGTPGTRVRRLLEALAICRQMFTHSGRVDFDGDFYTAHVDVAWQPTERTIPIVVGASRPRLIAAAGTYADRLEILAPDDAGDGFVLDADRLTTYMDSARASATAAGHPIEFGSRVTLRLGGSSAHVARPLEIGGTPDDVVDAVERLAALGFTRLTILPLDGPSAAWVRDNVETLKVDTLKAVRTRDEVAAL
jgi:alkanesulfonate monooxygenase SsuD/methylene tetrahydromethanopterin reductase-like flavin-dependent oxidoreductase (luciferase family)